MSVIIDDLLLKGLLRTYSLTDKPMIRNQPRVRLKAEKMQRPRLQGRGETLYLNPGANQTCIVCSYSSK